MKKITICYKNDIFPTIIHDTDEHYCTEKMFFVSKIDGSEFYVNLNEIFSISVEKEDEN